MTTMAGGKIEKKRQGSGARLQGGISFEKSNGQHISWKTRRWWNHSNRLLGAGGKAVVVVELDPRMVLELSRRFHGHPCPHA